ncbi:FadR/GntR family transcriptional regulator [Schinkia azotoformans]|uniref:GntR family transcriptional regulator n=1 Tax=Schinkia azotoformans LMG 9581 TaxID=1131731 RepID=K6BWX5_SCHAZ|nr:FadR/GntR family transcriptional regulator [Schinkia azotoformans]EKN63445.1 GntR family transcriptional regulator [Schinkia azotoformans LMG 9581]MEC1638744.1 FadR/GntR family transcriptional regulator [Schinkia azotoformans]MEC1946709.1 FadR/GntR family transcriptional regulator [Schinkia azotoformans]
MEIVSIQHNRLAFKVSQQIIELIKTGEYKPGERLPSERELAEKMGVSRGPLREALSALQSANIITTKTGAGTFVNEVIPTKKNAFKALASTLSDQSPIDILEVREPIEVKAVALAAENRTEQDIKNMLKALEKQKLLLSLGKDPKDADMEFHLAIAKATNNTVLEKTMELIFSLMDQDFWEAMMENLSDKIYKDEKAIKEYIWIHEEILSAIVNRNKEKAQLLMKLHLNDQIEKL